MGRRWRTCCGSGSLRWPGLSCCREWWSSSGLAFLRGVTSFSLLDLVNELGIGAFEGGRAELGGIPAAGAVPGRRPGRDGGGVPARRQFQEALAAGVAAFTGGARWRCCAPGPQPRLTEQVREFLASRGVIGNCHG